MEVTWRGGIRGEEERLGGKEEGIRSINERYKIAKGKNSIGNREGKQLICTTHGHEPSWGCRDADGSMEHRVEENKGEGKMRQL